MDIDATQKIRAFVLDEFLPEEEAGHLREDTPLITTGILDSLGVLKLMAFLERCFSIRIEAREVDIDDLNTIQSMCGLVESKLRGGSPARGVA